MLDPMENGLFDIPDYDNIDEETFPPLPPPFSPGEGGDPFTGEDNDNYSSPVPSLVPDMVVLFCRLPWLLSCLL